MNSGGRKPRTTKSTAPVKHGATKSPRIMTSPTTKAVVENLKEIATKNHRSVSREALIAVQSYILATMANEVTNKH